MSQLEDTLQPAAAAPAKNPWNSDTPFSYDEMWFGAKKCLEYMNRRVAGAADVPRLDYLWTRYLAPWRDDPSRRCLILGSNEGLIELHLCQHGFRGEIVASDIADRALARAREKVAEAGYTNVRHVLADLNTDTFEGEFDCIIASGVLHHIAEIERCLRMLRDRLKPGGLLLAIEFEGPFRFQLPELQVRWINAALNAMPKALRPFPNTGDGNFPPSAEDSARIHYVRATEESIVAFDPSEALSGPALKRLLPELFEVVERKGFGGTLLSYMTGHFDFRRSNTDPFVATWLDVLIRIEEAVIASGILEDEFVFYALKKPGAAELPPPPASAAQSPAPLPPADDQFAALRARYVGRFPVPAVSVGTVRDYCDSADHLPALANAQGDLKDLQRPWTVKALLGAVPPGGRLLEVGGGEPLAAALLAQLGYEVTVVDPYDGSGRGPTEFAEFARCYPRVRLVRRIFECGLEELRDERFDAIYSISVLEHVPEPALGQLFAAIAEHLKPGGHSLHCMDCVSAGKGDQFHIEQGDRVLAYQQTLTGVPADRDERASDSRARELVDRAHADLETFYLSAAGHNLWRGGLSYDDFPFRKVISLQTVVRSATANPAVG
ncbi:MAG: methyltransferase domain-containing protein [Verrucomicrobia bacterium]|nr:methyltransferase domain-containing protein [Verrucomicrobiota bacterium]